MINQPTDFAAESSLLDGMLADRDRINAGVVRTGIKYIDDCLGGIYPRDLMLVGAATGVGKTELAISVACASVRAGRKTFVFALEAEVGEVASRLYYSELARRVHNTRMDYASWRRGLWADADRQHGEQIRESLRPLLDRMHVMYKRRGDFTTSDLSVQIERIMNQAEMVVLDHIHVIDTHERESELSAQAKTIRLLRDMALDAGIPVLVASHLRKRTQGAGGVTLPELDDLHGASALSKVATQVVLLARDWDGDRMHASWFPTFIRVAKDRRGRGGTFVARAHYDASIGGYVDHYNIGKMVTEARVQVWRELEPRAMPVWAAI